MKGERVPGGLFVRRRMMTPRTRPVVSGTNSNLGSPKRKPREAARTSGTNDRVARASVSISMRRPSFSMKWTGSASVVGVVPIPVGVDDEGIRAPEAFGDLRGRLVERVILPEQGRARRRVADLEWKKAM